MQSYNVDWNKTIENIKYLLKSRTYVGNFSDAFSLAVRSVQHKLSSKNKSGLSVEELAIIARYLCCDILDLVVFETDTFFTPDPDAMKQALSVDDSTPEAVTSSLLFLDEEYMSLPIRNVYELLLYLPLIDELCLRDVVYRCYGNYGPTQRDYIMHQLKYLYREIPKSPEKTFADYCRDHELRVKGEKFGLPLFNPIEGETEYWSALWSYRQSGNNSSNEESFAARHTSLGRRFNSGVQERCSASDVETGRKTGNCESSVGERADYERDC